MMTLGLIEATSNAGRAGLGCPEAAPINAKLSRTLFPTSHSLLPTAHNKPVHIHKKRARMGVLLVCHANLDRVIAFT